MAQNVYEGLFLFDSNQFARDRSALPKEVEEMITKGDGEVLVSRLWEERKLAYPINGQRKGTYWLIYFRNDGQVIGPLNRQCEIHDGILRQLVTKIHPRLVEPILAHATGRQDSYESHDEESETSVNSEVDEEATEEVVAAT